MSMWPGTMRDTYLELLKMEQHNERYNERSFPPSRMPAPHEPVWSSAPARKASNEVLYPALAAAGFLFPAEHEEQHSAGGLILPASRWTTGRCPTCGSWSGNDHRHIEQQDRLMAAQEYNGSWVEGERPATMQEYYGGKRHPERLRRQAALDLAPVRDQPGTMRDLLFEVIDPRTGLRPRG